MNGCLQAAGWTVGCRFSHSLSWTPSITEKLPVSHPFSLESGQCSFFFHKSSEKRAFHHFFAASIFVCQTLKFWPCFWLQKKRRIMESHLTGWWIHDLQMLRRTLSGVGAGEEDEEKGLRRRLLIGCSHPCRVKPRGEEGLPLTYIWKQPIRDSQWLAQPNADPTLQALQMPISRKMFLLG